ncbi:putative 2-amino-4-hydroxy-6-hydroxymethyldihydropteridine pyrophosphokinase/dihydrofolate reductase [Selenomonas ruminantium subsp. lactilytica TAM6421]|uniref:2-amino-4-hydroxy-6-hydroxymethyldihydropteridine diphosphokinase n=1 Tax=Selenomonas ruminantium subsp. lactilytica (strain NBRC 103574 / TAM6421) TaxID=927704 RepID=I0GUJ6_SELRL|nr:2-amino-4-hydroxy-6-hydroxymethyldihydropteridine diphosphokinase [Selenomonas ruminantium]BAL84433.1 putative 2-amino-4-hydroxy-6-hydroxymethyldihydropteridine pyrophosphokinase/dihydrofolate reductase [Selenomonas ruminantium subsp. lactilytica TAM6421]
MKIYLSLGANLGNRGETLREAMRRLARLPHSRLLSCAHIYETAPWGKTDQPPFLNTAALIDTSLAPLEFLHHTQKIETDLGRVRHEHWGARTIDIDLLAAEGVTSATDELKLPHPYLTQRAFVLVPLREIAPDLIVDGRTVEKWCETADIRKQEITVAPEVHEPYPLTMIACVDEKLGIGRAGKLLLYNKEDMAHFRQQTLGQVVIMGRRTLESLPEGKPLADRINIVLSRTLQREDVIVCRELSELWTTLGRIRQDSPAKKFICIGGGEVYSLLLPYAKELLLTEVAGEFAADTFFPAVDDFFEASRETRHELSFVRLVRAPRLLPRT